MSLKVTFMPYKVKDWFNSVFEYHTKNWYFLKHRVRLKSIDNPKYGLLR